MNQVDFPEGPWCLLDQLPEADLLVYLFDIDPVVTSVGLGIVFLNVEDRPETVCGTTPRFAVLDIPNAVKTNGKIVARIAPPLEKTCCQDQAAFFCLLLTMSPTSIRRGCIQTFENRSMKQMAIAA